MKSSSRKFLSIAAMAVVSIGANAGYGYTITTPAGLNVGDHFYLVFVTADSIAATSSSLSTYDTFAQSEAATGGTDTYGSQSITWEALGSTNSTNAISRFDPGNVPVYLVDGTPIANSTDDIWSGHILNPINVNSAGAAEANTSVWTGTSSNGTEPAGFYTPPKATNSMESPSGLGNPPVEFGSTYYTDYAWVDTSYQTFENNDGVNIKLPIYAFSSELTVTDNAIPNQPVPLPSSAAMTAVGTMLLALRAAAGRLKLLVQ
ncbi:MAG TPA: hypothetical protein VG722_10520 [Tepidisphaeraceae bacterium]|nr:hypothetical protein [Tepidisphaeraceae bacterium]